jgi:tetraacyldisaccharide 4'-kinase
VNALARWLLARWYQGAPVPFWLGALERVFILLSGLRRWSYRRGWLPSAHPGIPVVVVGNLVVGGSGKTPLVVALVQALKAHGWKPGVVSRGYGRRGRGLRLVASDCDPADCGDEPLEIRRLTDAPVAVAADRLAAARALAASGEVDCIVADDGLQHYRLRRDIEIVAVDGVRGLGNGRRLPAGPLREAPSRLREADLVLVRDGQGGNAWSLLPTGFVRLHDGVREAIADWRGRSVYAVAGLADPARFFAALAQMGLVLQETRAFPDHHRYRREDLLFADPLPVVMTGKDAVKCRDFGLPTLWMLEVQASLPASAIDALVGRLQALRDGASRT